MNAQLPWLSSVNSNGKPVVLDALGNKVAELTDGKLADFLVTRINDYQNICDQLLEIGDRLVAIGENEK